MVNVGATANYVDTQDVNLTNLSDSKTYKKVLLVNFLLSRKLTKRELTNDTVDNRSSLLHVSISGKMRITNPEIPDLITLLGTGSAAPISKTWSIEYVDSSGTIKNLSINGQLFKFDIMDTVSDVVTADFSLEGDEIAGVT